MCLSKIRIRTIASIASLVALSGLAAAPATAQISLTGFTLYNSSSNGAFNGGYWDTIPGNVGYNAYLFSGSSASPVFLNSGDTAGTLTPSIVLSTPGTYVFNFATATSPSASYGMNLYFDGDSSNNRITAVTNAGTSSFSQVGAGISTYGLQSSSAPSANSLTYTGLNGFTATLSDFRLTQTAGSGGLDLVQNYNNTPGGGSDNIGQFTLIVTGPTGNTAAPEPGSLALLLPLMGVGGIVLRKRR